MVAINKSILKKFKSKFVAKRKREIVSNIVKIMKAVKTTMIVMIKKVTNSQTLRKKKTLRSTEKTFRRISTNQVKWMH